MPTHDITSGGLRTRAEAADYLRTSKRRLDDLIRAGAITAVRDGRQVKIAATELERFVNALPVVEAS